MIQRILLILFLLTANFAAAGDYRVKLRKGKMSDYQTRHAKKVREYLLEIQQLPLGTITKISQGQKQEFKSFKEAFREVQNGDKFFLSEGRFPIKKKIELPEKSILIQGSRENTIIYPNHCFEKECEEVDERWLWGFYLEAEDDTEAIFKDVVLVHPIDKDEKKRKVYFINSIQWVNRWGQKILHEQLATVIYRPEREAARTIERHKLKNVVSNWQLHNPTDNPTMLTETEMILRANFVHKFIQKKHYPYQVKHIDTVAWKSIIEKIFGEALLSKEDVKKLSEQAKIELKEGRPLTAAYLASFVIELGDSLKYEKDFLTELLARTTAEYGCQLGFSVGEKKPITRSLYLDFFDRGVKENNPVMQGLSILSQRAAANPSYCELFAHLPPKAEMKRVGDLITAYYLYSGKPRIDYNCKQAAAIRARWKAEKEAKERAKWAEMFGMAASNMRSFQSGGNAIFNSINHMRRTNLTAGNTKTNLWKYSSQFRPSPQYKVKSAASQKRKDVSQGDTVFKPKWATQSGIISGRGPGVEFRDDDPYALKSPHNVYYSSLPTRKLKKCEIGSDVIWKKNVRFSYKGPIETQYSYNGSVPEKTKSAVDHELVKFFYITKRGKKAWKQVWSWDQYKSYMMGTHAEQSIYKPFIDEQIQRELEDLKRSKDEKDKFEVLLALNLLGVKDLDTKLPGWQSLNRFSNVPYDKTAIVSRLVDLTKN